MTTPYGLVPLWEIRCGDVRQELLNLPDASVNCVVTSPPYWGLRDYGVGAANGEMGSEAMPDEYVQSLVSVFREIRRVLTKDGCVFLNIGDSYASQGGSRDYGSSDNGTGRGDSVAGIRTAPLSLKPKDLCMIPARVALALQADGWYLRAEIVWAKPNPMPESVTDRPTRSHEMIYLLSKQSRYYFDATAIAEQVINPDVDRKKPPTYGGAKYQLIDSNIHSGKEYVAVEGQTRNARDVWTIDEDEYGQFLAWKAAQQPEPRDVWTISSEAFSGSHFATFPRELARRCIVAGSPAQVCGVCGKPWVRRVERKPNPNGVTGKGNHREPVRDGGFAERQRDYEAEANIGEATDLGFFPTCDHAEAETRAGVVLDPFAGSGTTILAALNEGRKGIGIELSPAYAEMARNRIIGDKPLLNATTEGGWL